MQHLVNSIQLYKKKSHLYIALLVSLFAINFSFGQFDVPDVPKEQTSVYDYISLLSSTEKNSLEQKLIKYSDTTSTQIVVAIIGSTKGENIGLLAPRWAHDWGIGQAKEDNGVFVLLARDDRKIWIAPGYGVEHKLTAGITGELIRNVIIPEFKYGNYYAGLDKGTDAVFQVLMGEYQGSRKSSNSSGGLPIALFVMFFIFIVFIIAISKSRRGGGRNGGSGGNKSDGFSILDAIILSNMGRGSYGGSSSGGFGGGGFSGGGFGGGFGGGGFSGGGAGGSW